MYPPFIDHISNYISERHKKIEFTAIKSEKETDLDS